MKEKDLKKFTDAEIKAIKEKYVSGTKIKLLEPMKDEMYSVEAGTIGEVDFVDDIGTIHMDWDSGSSLGLIPEVDSFEIVSYPEKIKVISVEVGKNPVVKEIYNTLKAKQQEVGGLIQCIPTYFSNNIPYDFILNDEGKLMGLTPNRYIFDEQDVIAGNFLISKANEEGEFVSLTDEECEFIIGKVNELCPVADPNLDLNKYLDYEIYMEDFDK